MKVLILTCSTGGGHNSAAKALKEELDRRNIPCELKDPLSLNGHGDIVAQKIYNGIVTKKPGVFGFFYRFADKISSAKRKSPVYMANALCAKDLLEYITSNGFDTVLCPHLFPAEMITYMKKHFKKLKIKCYGVSTDYCCSPFWAETDMDGYFIPHEKLAGEFIKKGVPAEKLVCTGIPVSKSYAEKYDKEAAKKQLGYDKFSKIYLVMSGSMGFGKVGDIVEALHRITSVSSCIVIITGNNASLRSTLDKRFAHSQRIFTVGFTKDIPIYMAASDVIMTKPGGLTSTEAAAARIPIIHTSPIPGCETVNASFFSSLGMSVSVPKNAKTVALTALAYATNKNRRDKMTEAQKKNVPGNAAALICDYITQSGTSRE